MQALNRNQCQKVRGREPGRKCWSEDSTLSKHPGPNLMVPFTRCGENQINKAISDLRRTSEPPPGWLLLKEPPRTVQPTPPPPSKRTRVAHRVPHKVDVPRCLWACRRTLREGPALACATGLTRLPSIVTDITLGANFPITLPSSGRCPAQFRQHDTSPSVLPGLPM